MGITRELYFPKAVDTFLNVSKYNIYDYVHIIIAKRIHTNFQFDSKPSKMVKLVAFAPPVDPGQTLTIRIYCVDDYDRQSEDREVSNTPILFVIHN